MSMAPVQNAAQVTEDECEDDVGACVEGFREKRVCWVLKFETRKA